MAKYSSGRYIRSGSRAVMTVLILILCALLLLFIGAGGKAIAENLLVPLFGDIKPSITPLPDGYVARHITLPRIDVYTLVLHTLDASDQASAHADAVRQKGGAGYVLKDNRYRVIAAGYQTAAQARSVANKQSQDYQPDVFLLSSGSISFNVTCSEETAQTLSDACSLYSTLISQMIREATVLEQGDISQSGVKIEYTRRSAEAKRMVERLENVPSGKDDGLITQLLTLYRNADMQFEKIYSKNYEYSLDFFADIRYNYIEMTVAYCNAIQNLT